MAKKITAKLDLGINSIMDPIMVPDGFARVCDGLDLRSGSARAMSYPSYHHVVSDPLVKCVWEYRNRWHESELLRTYHGEYLYGMETVYFTEEGINHLPPQKIIEGIQARLGTPRPLAKPIVSSYDQRYPTSLTAQSLGAGGVDGPVASYRVAAMKGGKILIPSSPVKISIVVTPTPVPINVQLVWRRVPGADAYAVFGRTPGVEKLLIKLGDVISWVDDGSYAEGSETAASYEVSQSYQYVYTYYRRVGTIEDESGPSLISNATEATSIPVITRLPEYDGLLSESTEYDLSSDNMTLTVPASAYKPFTYTKVNASSTVTVVTTDTAHGLTTGDKVMFTGSSYNGVEFSISTMLQLASPSVALNGTTPYPAGGTVPVGAHVYKFTAVRGMTPAQINGGGYNPAQTTATTVNATVAGVPSSVKFDVSGFTPGTDCILVYRDGNPIRAFDPSLSSSFTDDGSYATIPTVSIPASDETATRCFSVPAAVTTVWFFSFVIHLIATVQIPTATDFTPSAGDILYFSGVSAQPEINGSHYVISNVAGLVTMKTSYFPGPGSAVITAGSLKWNASNGYYAGWRIYRVGDTAEFLRVADLAMDVNSFTDLVPTDSLGVAIPTAYDENGLYVVYDQAPSELKRMVNHYGMRFGIVDGLVRWTPVGVPDAWPDVYYSAFPSRPVALQSFKNMLAVLCEDGLYGLAGNTASTMSPAGPFSDLGCIAPFSVQASNYGLLWLSKVGVCISQDGVSAKCLTSERLPGRFFYAPSTTGTSGVIGTGVGWLLDPRQTVQFAESMREEEIDYRDFPVTEVAFDLPANQEMTDIGSFFWDNRYTLFYSGTDMHARSGCISIDMSQPSLPVTTWPTKPVDVHVSQGGDLYMLLSPRPLMNVSFVVS